MQRQSEGTTSAWMTAKTPRFSPLDQIHRGNVSKLIPVWTFSTGVADGHEAPPIVNDGVLYVTTPQNQVLAF